MPGQDLIYIDGFAGPGAYANDAEGSPVAALRAAATARSSSGAAWQAALIRCTFIEQDHDRFLHLDGHVAPFRTVAGLTIDTLNASFIDGVAQLRSRMPEFAVSPLFAFIDPFGATGVPFSVVVEILRNPKAEVLINLDADGIARILRAAHVGSNGGILDLIFGDRSWASVITSTTTFEEQCRATLDLYRSKLRDLPGVKYTFPFEMRSKADSLQYYLLFASQHHLGLEKMKEAMKTIDSSGAYCFSDGRIQQERLFRFDHPEDYSRQAFDRFRDQRVSYDVMRDYALNETPFTTPRGILKVLEQQDKIDVLSNDPMRRRGTFPDGKIDHIKFHPTWDSVVTPTTTPTQLALW